MSLTANLNSLVSSESSGRTLRVGVSGLGKLGQYHFQKVLSLSKEYPIHLSALHDPSSEVLLKCQSALATEKVPAKFFQSFEEFVGQVDLVVLASPSELHYSQAKKVLESGKHLFCEKPLALTAREAFELCLLAKENHLALGVGHNERLNPAFLGLREAFKKTPASKPILLRAVRDSVYHPRVSGVSVIDDLMIHDLDLFCEWWMEFNPEAFSPEAIEHLTEVGAFDLAKVGFKGIIASGGKVVSKEIDWAHARLELAIEKDHAVLADFFSSRVSPQLSRTFSVTTDTTSYWADLQNLSLKVLDSEGEQRFLKSLPEEKYPPVDSLRKEQELFYQAVCQGQHPVDFRAALAVSLAEKIKAQILGALV